MFTFSARTALRASSRAFSTSSPRAADMAKLCLIGRLGKEPELRYTKTNKEYVAYVVATANSTAPEAEPTTTWHHVLSFLPHSSNYLRSLKKGSLVYVEASYEVRQPDANADPNSPEGQRQIFLKHENLRVLRQPSGQREETDLE
ncbi:nucleic acid-binding protein [Ganoderma leucocontextum]|nr:nucleic acid-binding protein [Ganoderma leucocontextum]